MCMKGGYTSLSSSLSSTLDEKYPAEGIASFIACKKYDETVTVVNTSKVNDVCRGQQLVEHDKGTKSILVVDDEYDTNLTLKVVLEESGFKSYSQHISNKGTTNVDSLLSYMHESIQRLPKAFHDIFLCNNHVLR